MDECGPSSRRTVCGAASTSDSDSTADDAPLLENDHTAIDVDVHEVDKPASRHDRFPKERGKAVVSALESCDIGYFGKLSIAYVFEFIRMPPNSVMQRFLDSYDVCRSSP